MVIAKQKVGSFAFRGSKQQGRITAWHSGERWGGGASDCDSPCSGRARAASRRPRPGPQLAVTQASLGSQQEPAASAAAFQRAEFMRALGGAAAWSAPTGWPVSCKDAQCRSSLPPFSSLPYPRGRETLQELAFPLGISTRDVLRSLMRNLDAWFRRWCWKLLYVDPCPWDSPTCRKDAPNWAAFMSACSKGCA